MRITMARTPGSALSAYASPPSPTAPSLGQLDMGTYAFLHTHLGTHTCPCSPAQIPPYMQHAHTSLLVNRHRRAHTFVCEIGGLWQDSQDPTRSLHPSTSSLLSLGWTSKSARPQAGSVRTLPSLLGKCQFGKVVCERHADLASNANSGPKPRFPSL